METIEYPDLSKENIIGLDIESYDPNLIEYGPGVYRQDGRILGVSLATPSGFAEYYDIGHYDCSPETKEKNLKYLEKILALPMAKLGANLLYDVDWLENFQGLKVNGNLHDVQVAEPLLNEYAYSYSLDTLAKQYLDKGKYKTEIQAFCDENGLKGDPRIWIYKMPYAIVRAYAKVDAIEPIEISKHQIPKLKEQKLFELYKKEMKLFRPLLAMRKNGVNIDVDYVDAMTEEIVYDIEDKTMAIYDKIGYEMNFTSTKQLAELFDELGLLYNRNPITEKMKEKGIEVGNPSITKDDLEHIDNPLIQEIYTVRKLKRALKAFFINSFTKNRVVDKIHTSFYPLRTDDRGTVSGRFSSANPNLQQIPARDKYIGPMCRRAFIPVKNHLWFKLDWSQVEYRVIAHYAEGPGSEEIREAYNKDPNTDYHEQIMKRTGLERKPAKNLNFGLAYCMGATTAAKKFGWALEYAMEVVELYHEKIPFLKHTINRVIKAAKSRGFIRTLLNRRARVKDIKKTYVLFNRLIQGTAADIMKEAMIQAWDKGLFDILIMSLTVHDELDGSMPITEKGIEAVWELKQIMENCVKLKVPIKAVLEIGTNWKDTKEYDNIEEIKKEFLK